MQKVTLAFAYLVITLSSALAQDISKLDWKHPIKLSGSLGGGTMLYTTTKAESRRDPFFWSINGNLNIDLLGVIQIPINLSLSQQNSDVSAQPFNQFGLSPSYKSITVHGGYRSMEFSPFTLSGNIFLGGGIEVIPDGSLIRVSAMYGRFSKAIQQGGQVGILSGEPTYERWGYGAKIGIGRNTSNAVDLIFFKAKDDPNSISEQPNTAPAENVVLGLITKQKLSKKILFDMDFGYSVYTEDSRFNNTESTTNITGGDVPDLFKNLMNINLSSSSSYAIKTGIGYNLEKYQVRLNYQRINPNYRSMGTAFINNDLENISLNVSWNMFQSKLNLTAGGGVQRNNLDNSLATNLRRVSYNFNATYSPTNKLNFSGAYSNFSSSTSILASSQNITDPTLRLDSLRLLQVTNSASLMVVYSFGTKTRSQSLNLNTSYQGANDQDDNATAFYNASLGYNYRLKKSNLNIKTAYNFNQNIAEMTNVTTGPTLSIGKGFLKNKMKFNWASTVVSAFVDGENTGTNSTHRLTWKYGIKKHSFSSNINYLIRSSQTQESFSELRAGLNYNYSF